MGRGVVGMRAVLRGRGMDEVWLNKASELYGSLLRTILKAMDQDLQLYDECTA